jgi:hypothetical protein
MVRNIAEDVRSIFITMLYFVLVVGIQLRTTPIDTKDKAKIRKRLQKPVMH